MLSIYAIMGLSTLVGLVYIIIDLEFNSVKRAIKQADDFDNTPDWE